MGKVIFAIVILAWLFCGFCGIINCKKDRVHWDMIGFMLFFPFIPLIAHLCGLI